MPVPVVRSRITYPDGDPATMVRVAIRIIASPHWHADGTGVTLGLSTTWTGRDGWWESNVVPYTVFEDDRYVYAEVVEQGPGSACHRYYLRVPDVPGPLLMRDLLINPPDPGPDPGPDGWRPISSLGDLRNVDRDADAPTDGAVLVWERGEWRPGQASASTLAQLTDVDAGSVADAKPGDPLVWLGADRGWGVSRPAPAVELRFRAGDDSTDPTGYTLALTLTSRTAGRPVTVDWGDMSTGLLDAATDTASHRYAPPGGDVSLLVAYGDDGGEIGQPEAGSSDFFTIPFPRSSRS